MYSSGFLCKKKTDTDGHDLVMNYLDILEYEYEILIVLTFKLQSCPYFECFNKNDFQPKQVYVHILFHLLYKFHQTKWFFKLHVCNCKVWT